MFVTADYWQPFIPPSSGRFGEFGWSGVLRGAGVIFFAYIGFDAVSTAAQEAKDPQRDMPIGIFASLLLCTVLYVLVSGVMVGLVPYQQLGVPAPMALAVDAARVKAAGTAWAADRRCHADDREARCDRGVVVHDHRADGRAAAHFHVDVAGRTPARLGGRDPPALPHPARHDHRHRRDRRARRGLTPINVLGELVSIGTLFAFVIVAIGVIVLRRTRPDLHRPFRTPGVPWLPMLSAASLIRADGQPVTGTRGSGS